MDRLVKVEKVSINREEDPKKVKTINISIDAHAYYK